MLVLVCRRISLSIIDGGLGLASALCELYGGLPDVNATVPELCSALREIYHLLADRYVRGDCDGVGSAICALTQNLVKRFFVPGCQDKSRAFARESFSRRATYAA